MYVFRLHVRPQGGATDVKTTFDYCLRNKLLGVGWRVNDLENTTDWNAYYSEAKKIHENLNVCKYIKKWVGKGDLIWTRDQNAQYYLAQVQSGWEYFATEEAREKDIDIANIFRCDIQKIELDSVPGKVIACFRPTRTFQEIADSKAVEFSKYLWNEFTDNKYPIDNNRCSDVFMMLDSEEMEDVIFLYLQSLGWYVLPNSRKLDTMRFEFLLVNSTTFEKGLMQVKTGEVVINQDEYKDVSDKVFLFQSNEKYSGTASKNINCISRDDVYNFLKNSVNWLPKTISKKLQLAINIQKS